MFKIRDLFNKMHACVCMHVFACMCVHVCVSACMRARLFENIFENMLCIKWQEGGLWDTQRVT